MVNIKGQTLARGFSIHLECKSFDKDDVEDVFNLVISRRTKDLYEKFVEGRSGSTKSEFYYTADEFISILLQESVGEMDFE